MSLLSYLSLLNIPLQAFEICARYHWKEVPTRMESWETGTAGHRVPILSLFHPPPSTLSPEIVSKLFFFFSSLQLPLALNITGPCWFHIQTKAKREVEIKESVSSSRMEIRVAHCFYLFFDSRSSSNLPGENVEGETRSESFLILENVFFLFSFWLFCGHPINRLSVSRPSISLAHTRKIKMKTFDSLSRENSNDKKNGSSVTLTTTWQTYFIVTKTLMMSLKTKLSHASPLRLCKKKSKIKWPNFGPFF